MILHIQILHLMVLGLFFIEIAYWSQSEEKMLHEQILSQGSKYIFPSDATICILLFITGFGLVTNLCLMIGTREKHPLVVSVWLILQSVFILVEVVTTVLISVVFAAALNSLIVGLLIFFSSLIGTAVHLYMILSIYNIFCKVKNEDEDFCLISEHQSYAAITVSSTDEDLESSYIKPHYWKSLARKFTGLSNNIS